MKITFFSSMMPFAGMDNRVVSLSNRFVGFGHDISIFTFFLGRDDIDPRVKMDIYTPFNLEPNTFLFLSEYTVFRPLFSFPITKQLKKINPEILCTEYTPMDYYASKAKRRVRCKAVYTIHGLMANRRDLCARVRAYSGKKDSEFVRYHKHLRKILNCADLVVSVSKFTQKSLENYDINSIVILNGVDTKIFTPDKTLPSLTKTGPILLHVGRIMPHKGVHLLIDAFKQVKKEVRDASLYVVGETAPAYQRYLLALYKKVGASDSVFFLQNARGGGKDELLSRLYSIADVFTCASLFEGFGMPFLEAQSCGTPCVGFDVAAIPEVVKNGQTGFLVEEENVDEFAEATIKLLTDDKLRNRMGKAARKHAKELDWDIVADRALRIYGDIV